MIILNNHNSQPGWCCEIENEDGLWSTSRYNASAWAECLAGFAKRYAHEPMVIGMDLRNEIHDVKRLGRISTWGTSESIETDWKRATELASRSIAREHPDWLILVSGLCFSFDLRLLYPNLPEVYGGTCSNAHLPHALVQSFAFASAGFARCRCQCPTSWCGRFTTTPSRDGGPSSLNGPTSRGRRLHWSLASSSDCHSVAFSAVSGGDGALCATSHSQPTDF